MTVSRRQRLKASQYEEARTTTPRILRPRACACAVVAKWGGAEVSAVVASQCRSSVVVLSTLGAFVLLAQVQEREELVLDLKSSIGQSPSVRLLASSGFARGPAPSWSFPRNRPGEAWREECEACGSSTRPTPDFQEAPEKLSS